MNISRLQVAYSGVMKIDLLERLSIAEYVSKKPESL